MAANEWLAIVGRSLAALGILLVVGFGPAFNPGWANGWPLGLTIHVVWSAGMAVLFLLLLMASLAGIGAAVGAACACIGVGLRHGRAIYRGWLVCSCVLALLASFWAFGEIHESALEMWPGGYNPRGQVDTSRSTQGTGFATRRAHLVTASFLNRITIPTGRTSMIRILSATIMCAALAPAALAQGPLERVGQGLDRAGKNIRRSVEQGVAAGNVAAQENAILARVSERIKWDKKLAASTLRLTVSADNSVTLRGSVANDAAKARAVDLAENTVGVTAVVDEIAVVKEVRVVRPKVVPKPVIVEEVREEVITKP